MWKSKGKKTCIPSMSIRSPNKQPPNKNKSPKRQGYNTIIHRTTKTKKHFLNITSALHIQSTICHVLLFLEGNHRQIV